MKTRTAICAVLFATVATFVPVTRAQLAEHLRVGNVHPLTDVFDRKLDGPAYPVRARVEVPVANPEAALGGHFRLKLVR